MCGALAWPDAGNRRETLDVVRILKELRRLAWASDIVVLYPSLQCMNLFYATAFGNRLDYTGFSSLITVMKTKLPIEKTKDCNWILKPYE